VLSKAGLWGDFVDVLIFTAFEFTRPGFWLAFQKPFKSRSKAGQKPEPIKQHDLPDDNYVI
jgi:hypothetical protein